MSAEFLVLLLLAVAALVAWARQRWLLKRLLQNVRAGAWNTLQTQRLGLSGDLAQQIARATRELQAQLKQSEQFLNELLQALEHSPGGIVLLNEQGCLEWFNATAAAHFGLDRRRDLQQNLGFLVRDPSFVLYMTSWNFSREVVITTPNFEASKVPLRIAIQAHAYAGNRRLLLSRDVTAAERQEATRRDFVANVSHELRTPLTVLSGFIQSLKQLQLAPTEQERALVLMDQQSVRMQALVSDLLALSQLQSSPTPSAGQWFALADVIQTCSAEAQALAQTLYPSSPQRLNCHPCEVEIDANPREIASALTNLLTNAVRHTPGGRAIELGWQQHADGAGELWVQDHGQGIAPAHLSRLGERFYRVDASRSRDTGGTGLGLAIVKEIAARHGGELKIVSTQGVGSRFALWLPRQRVRSRTVECVHPTPGDNL